MTPSEIQPGMKFGHWEVLKFDHTNEHRIKYFLCRCDCGIVRPVRASALLNGTSTACSKTCSMAPVIGGKYGEWTVLGRDRSKPKNYICLCSCGNKSSVFGSSLKNGTSKSCGCLKSKKLKQNFQQRAESHVGETYGFLTIIGCELRGKDYWYNCVCTCGSHVWVLGKRLFSGVTVSCGCINSKANELMDKILTSYHIPFKREIRFEECKDKNMLPFDFGIYNNEEELIGLIELNGSLHYSSSGTGWNTPERLIKQQKHDYLKRLFCETNKIPFLVIPYQYFNELEKFLITSDFWRIIIGNLND